MTIMFLRYKASKGCTALRNALREQGVSAKHIRVRNSSYRGRQSDLIINWGTSSRRTISPQINIFNNPSAVRTASLKTDTFIKLSECGLGSNIPFFTSNKEEAARYIEEEGGIIYARTLINASRGRGIVICNSVEELVDANLYTGKVDVDREIRVHVFNGNVIDYAQKKRMNSERLEEEGITLSEDVRSHGNGWIFAREGIEIPDIAKEVSKRAINILGLDFGAVDIAINRQGCPIILEINTAPGLQGTTLERYTEAILSL